MPAIDLLQVASHRLLTIDDLPDERGFELIDGSMYVSPLGDVEHQDLCLRYAMALQPHLAGGCMALAGVNVIEGGKTLVEPDVAVFDADYQVRSGLGVSPEGLRFVIEVTSPSTRRRDLTVKQNLYYEWKVPYLVVDRGTTPYTFRSFNVGGVKSPYLAYLEID